MNFENIRPANGGEAADFRIGDDVVITFFKTNKFQGADFRLSTITKDGRQTWSFKTASVPLGGWSEIAEKDGQYVLMVRDRKKLYEATPVEEAGARQPILVGNEIKYIGGPSPEKSFALKKKLAKMCNLEVVLTDDEKAVAKHLEQVASAVAQKKLDEVSKRHEDEKARRQAYREKKRAELLARPKIDVWDIHGVCFSGIPVANFEWERLSDVFVILMDDKWQPVEAFTVVKKNAMPFKSKPFTVFAEAPKPVQPVKAERLIDVQLKGKPPRKGVPVLSDMNTVKRLQESGVNHGTWVAVPADARHPDRLQILAIHSKDIETIGMVRPTAKQATP